MIFLDHSNNRLNLIFFIWCLTVFVFYKLLKKFLFCNNSQEKEIEEFFKSYSNGRKNC